jgi:hypothetical protein
MLIRSDGELGVKTLAFGGGFAQTLALEGEPVRIMDKAIENGIGDGGIAENRRRPSFLIG